MEEETKNEKTEGEGTEVEEPQTETTKAEETKAEDTKTEEVKVVETEAEETEVEEIKAEETNAQETKPEEKKTEETAEKEKPLDKMTALELRDIARKIPGVDGVHAMKKQQLLEVVKKARGIEDEEPAKKIAKEIDVKALKEKIARLKVEKAAAREAKDRQKVDVIRRRINRLKKRTRKAA
jgi:hypothetical protein